ncbi:7-cyano-7-deazaguanine synthase [Aestuariivita boseongensis]|uniref:7-cyano-7-deazaguanine synthase n=1 Tax=Aestuariivita boseongensis TaxID=1470562 RepID=UPI001FDF0A56|nr:7-cyano-7-deazaguanine synthase [Aestuariivita boseongensis]
MTRSGGDQVLRFDLNGEERAISLKISQLTQRMVAGLPDRTLDLLELAALVYAVDSSVSRGGPALQKMGAQWHRRFRIEMAVRDLAFWEQSDVSAALEALLAFLSGDTFTFTFGVRKHSDAERNRFFKFGEESAWSADRVLMFSGGLDSYAGALEETVRQGFSVALVSHASSTKIERVQKDLLAALRAKLNPDLFRHVPVRMQMVGGVKEGTHRSRSFLFATLGAVTAFGFGQERVSFYENGVVSLNLPPVGNVQGTRATRTTHPKSLLLMSQFLGLVFENGMRIDNPFFWHTKTEVVEKVAQLEMAEQIRHTRSCADVHNQTNLNPHCGRCSQCVDRRFAVLAAGLETQDPKEAYAVELLDGLRKSVIDKETALSYVRAAQQYVHATPDLLQQRYPEVFQAVECFNEPAPTALSRIAGLLKRHGQSVISVMNHTLDHQAADAFPVGSLPWMYGEEKRQAAFSAGADMPTISLQTSDQTHTIVFDDERQTATVADVVDIPKGANFNLLRELATEHLCAAGQGIDPLDYPTIAAPDLSDRLGLASDEALRQRVNRARKALGRLFEAAGLDADQGAGLIENIPWHGYRLNPTLVTVRIKSATL